MSLFIRAVWHGRRRCAPDGGTACRIGNHHSVAEELCDNLQIRRFTAACTCAGKLEVRLEELTTFYAGLFNWQVFFLDGHSIIPVVCFVNHIGISFHLKCLFLCWTDVCAVAAAHTVKSRKLHPVVQSVKLCALRFDGLKTFWRCCQFLIIEQHRSDCRVRADKGALIALDTFCHIPLRQMYSYAAFFVSAGAQRERAIRVIDKGADRKIFAFLFIHRNQHFFYEYRQIQNLFFRIFCIQPACRNLNLLNCVDTFINSFPVHLDDLLTFFLICLFDTFFQVFDCVIYRNNLGQFEKGSLHNHVDSAAKTDGFTNFPCVDGIEVDFFLCQCALYACRQMFVHFLRCPQTVEQEGAALLQILQHVVLSQICLVMTGNEIRSVNAVSRLNRIFTKTQMRNGYAARFFGVIRKISLCI